MEAPTSLGPPVRVAFGSLIDYAGLFPPAQLPLERARVEYEAARAGPYAWMLGRFVIPAASLPLQDRFDAAFSAIVDPSVDALDRVAQLRGSGANIAALEIPLAKSVSQFRERLSRDEILDVVGALEADITVAGLRAIPAYLEIPRAQPWRGSVAETLDAIARVGLGAKLRCGGAVAEAFPSVDEVATFIAAAQAAGVAFKATAGLHHPVRHRDAASGFVMHGFLNLLAAAALASRVTGDTLERIVAEEDPAAFRFDEESFLWRDQRVDLGALERTRAEFFVGYGSCSFSEPVDDLTALGILPAQ